MSQGARDPSEQSSDLQSKTTSLRLTVEDLQPGTYRRGKSSLETYSRVTNTRGLTVWGETVGGLAVWDI